MLDEWLGFCTIASETEPNDMKSSSRCWYGAELHCCKKKAEKIVQKTHIVQLHCIVELQTGSLCTPLLSKVGKGHYVDVRAKLRPSRSMWVENIANASLPYTNIWETLKCHNFNSKAWIKDQISSFDPFCMPI